ncbi:MAG: tetratricopeptide repeat protein [Tepidisphaeraceae bacterium]
MESRWQACSGRNTEALHTDSDVLGAASDPGELTGLPQEKRCIDCNVDVSHQARYKDSDGRYRCRSCEFARRSADAVEVDPSPFVYAESVPRRLLVWIVIALLAVIVSMVAYLYFDGRWERLHRDTILSLKAAADSDFAANRLPEAMHGYESIVRLVGQHQLESQTLQSEVEMSRQRILGLQVPLQQIEEKRRLQQVRAEVLAQAEESDRLGQVFEFGNGQTQDLHKAVECYQKAADAGLAPGMRDMGRMYDPRLNTVFEDGEKALWWYGKAVEGGDVVAAFLKARLLYDGTDVKRDRQHSLRHERVPRRGVQCRPPAWLCRRENGEGHRT